MPEARPATTKMIGVPVVGLPLYCREGDSGPVVSVVQDNLGRLGYDIGTEDRTYIFGEKTEEAVRRLQADNDIPVTGMVIDNATWRALFKPVEPAPPAPTPEAVVPAPAPEAKPLISTKWAIPLAVGGLLLMSRRKKGK